VVRRHSMGPRTGLKNCRVGETIRMGSIEPRRR